MSVFKGVQIFANTIILQKNNIYKLMCKLAQLLHKSISNELKQFCLDSMCSTEIEHELIFIINKLENCHFDKRKQILNNYISNLKSVRRCGINIHYSKYITFLTHIS